MHRDKIYFLRTSFFLGLLSYLTTILKTYYHDPRPIQFTHDTLDNYSQMQLCSLQRGKPSGHVSFAAYTTISLWIQYTDIPKTSKKALTLLYLASQFLISNIAFSRFYLLGHSLNQIYYGLSLGLFVGCLELYFLKPFSKYFKMLVQKNPFKLQEVRIRTFFMVKFVLTLWAVNF